MATISIPSLNSAYGYAANFNPLFNAASLAKGYQGVQSSAGTQMMAKAAELEFLAKSALTREAFGALGSALQQNSVNKTSEQLLAMNLEDNQKARDANKKTNKLNALLRLVGGASQIAMPDFASPLDGLNGITDRLDRQTYSDDKFGQSLGIFPQMYTEAGVDTLSKAKPQRQRSSSGASGQGLTSNFQPSAAPKIEMRENSLNKAFPNAVPGFFSTKKKETK
jgi:hypothetical protein